MKEPRIKLITRADDLGGSHSANLGIKEAFEKGILKNTSVLAPAPFVEEAAQMLAGAKGFCFGMHTDFTAEWTNFRWGPVSPAGKVRSLVDAKGRFFQTSEALSQQDPEPDEMITEAQAQLDKLRRLGFDIKYIDMHMGAFWVIDRHFPKKGIKYMDIFNKWAEKQGLIFASRFRGWLPFKERKPHPDRLHDGDLVADVIEALKAAKPGQYILVGHPGYDNEETQNFGHPGYPGHAVAKNLNQERLMFMDPRIVSYCRENDVEPIRYDEAVPDA